MERGGEDEKGILYPHLRTSTTQSSAPHCCHVCQNGAKQPPTWCNEGDDSYLAKFGFDGEGDLEELGGGVPEKRTRLGDLGGVRELLRRDLKLNPDRAGERLGLREREEPATKSTMDWLDLSEDASFAIPETLSTSSSLNKEEANDVDEDNS